MGFAKQKRPVLSPRFKSFAAGSTSTPFLQGKQKATITVTSTATILPETGTAVLNATAAGDKTFRLPTPVAGGRVFVSAVDSTHVHTIRTKTSAETFFGTTMQSVAWSTSLGYRAATFEVIGPSTGLKWALVAASTGSVIA